MRAVMAPRWDFFFDWREYGKYGMTAVAQKLASCPTSRRRRPCAGSVAHTSDLVRTSALTRRDEDKQLHNTIIHLAAATLHHKDILLSNTRHDLDTRFALSSDQPLRDPSTTAADQLTLANWESSTPAGAMPRFMHIWLVSSGTELPAKMSVLRIVRWGVVGGWDIGRREGMRDLFT